MSKRFRYLLLLMLLPIFPGTSVFAPAAKAETPKKILLLPFDIHSSGDLGYLQKGIQDMLASRLAVQGQLVTLRPGEIALPPQFQGKVQSEAQAREAGLAAGVDFVLYGSLTVIGNSVSMDGRLVDVLAQNPGLTFYNQSQGMDSVISRIDLFAKEIKKRVFGGPAADTQIAVTPPPAPDRVQPPAAPAPSAPAAPQAPSTVFTPPAAPAKAAQPAIAPQATASSPFILPDTQSTISGAWKSRAFDRRILGLAVADVDGDGLNEILTADKGEIQVARFASGGLNPVAVLEDYGSVDFLAMDAADMDGNGKAEVFVNTFDDAKGRINCRVFEYKAGGFVQTGDLPGWGVRVVSRPAKAPVLLGQKCSTWQIFSREIHELKWDGATYAPGKRIALSTNIDPLSVFGMAVGDFLHDQTSTLAALDEENHLRLISQNGEQVHITGETYGGSENYLVDKTEAYTLQLETRKYIPQRIVCADVNQDGRPELVVIEHNEAKSLLFGKYRWYKDGQFDCLAWDGQNLVSQWKTVKMAGYTSDYALADLDNDGRPELIAAVVSTKGKVFRDTTSVIQAFGLEALELTEK